MTTTLSKIVGRFAVAPSRDRFKQILSTGGDDDFGAVIDYTETARARGWFRRLVVPSGSVDEYVGTGSPEGVVTAGIGSQYRRTDGATGTALYVKETGSGNTGWVGHGAAGPVGAAGAGSRADARNSAAGILTETYSLELLTTAGVPASGTIYGGLIGLVAGDVVTKIDVAVAIAGVGTTPTLIKVGLADASGTIVAVSANEAANAAWGTVGVAQISLTTPYTVPAQGGYRVVFLQVGSFGTTNMSLGRAGSLVATNLSNALSGGVRRMSTNGTGQTDLPAVSSALPANGTAVAGNIYWYAVS